MSGVVKDSTGAVVTGASVVVKPISGAEHVATTGADGRFTVDMPVDGDVTVIVRAGGFAEKSQRVGSGDRGREIEIVLQPATLLETVTVTPTRTEQRLGDVPARVSVLTSEQIQASPALMADDVLRQNPTFSLFRRASSLVAQPTTQGVSLRGIGPSGQSRTLVLLDDIPFNDPFGGWVYWSRVPLVSVDRIEITEGTSSSLNGKVGEVNDTRWTTVNGGVRMRMPDGSDLQGRVFVDVQKAHFNFLAVTNAATTRNLVRLATDQHVPTDGVGGMAQWTKAGGGAHLFSAGTDWRWVDGDSREDAFVAAVPTVIVPVTQQATLSVQRISGGTQQSLGAFVQDILTPTSKLVLTLSARVDHWRNYDGHTRETTVPPGLPTANHRPSLLDRTDTVVSPHIGALYHVSDRVTGWGAVNSGFRAPTLTELYRQFSVGAVTTRPNDQLGPERLVGGEAGINVAPARNVSVRLTWFDNRVRNPVSNVTLTATLAQKQNLGRTRVRGIQSDVEYRLGASWRFSGAYLYDQATVTDGGVANAALVGKFLPQVPKHRGSMQVIYSNPRYASVALGLQFAGLQFNDDLNLNFIPAATLTEAGYDASTGPGLPGYAMVDVTASRDLGRNLQVFVGVQNLLDQVYFVQTNPSTIGTPRLVNGGIRVRFAGR